MTMLQPFGKIQLLFGVLMALALTAIPLGASFARPANPIQNGFYVAHVCPDQVLLNHQTQQVKVNYHGHTYPTLPYEQQWLLQNCAGKIVDGFPHTNYNSLPACGNQTFSVLPVDNISVIDHIAPLGNINTPDHTVPTNHVYFALKRTGIGLFIMKANLLAPADGVINEIDLFDTFRKGVEDKDYQIFLSPCKEMTIVFGHVQSLNDHLTSLVTNHWDKNPCQQGHPADGITVTQCIKHVDEKVKANLILGTVGGTDQVGAFDFNVFDTRVDNGFINKQRNIGLDASYVCPLNLYTGSNKQTLYQFVQGHPSPACGTASYDLAGTARGNWYQAVSNPAGSGNIWNQQLALVYDNLDPYIGIVAVGGVITHPGQIYFTPQQSGNINRDPKEVTNDGQIYCYQTDNPTFNFQVIPNGRVLLKVGKNNTLLAEYQNQSCSSPLTFTNPTIYIR